VRRRFFVEQFTADTATMQGDAAHHLGNVLRAQPGQFYELSDGQRVRLGRVERVARDRVEFALLEEIPAHQPRVEVTLLLAIVKFDAFEWAIEKATELGVATIVPLVAARSEKAQLAPAAKRAARWRKLLSEASQQSRRVRVPVLQDAARPADALPMQTAAIKVLLSERREAPPLRQLLTGATASSAALAIGPEGGWTEEEFALAQKSSFREASLGKLILRTETAVVAALASINYALGN
jgi:16S rRNA (uracil1498-N3)-methyltransferase